MIAVGAIVLIVALMVVTLVMAGIEGTIAKTCMMAIMEKAVKSYYPHKQNSARIDEK